MASTGVVPGSSATGSVRFGGLASASESSLTTPLSLLPSQSTTGDCKAFCAGVGGVQRCVSSVVQLSSAFLTASLSTLLVGLTALVSFEGSYGVCSFCGEDH